MSKSINTDLTALNIFGNGENIAVDDNIKKLREISLRLNHLEFSKNELQSSLVFIHEQVANSCKTTSLPEYIQLEQLEFKSESLYEMELISLLHHVMMYMKVFVSDDYNKLKLKLRHNDLDWKDVIKCIDKLKDELFVVKPDEKVKALLGKLNDYREECNNIKNTIDNTYYIKQLLDGGDKMTKEYALKLSEELYRLIPDRKEIYGSIELSKIISVALCISELCDTLDILCGSMFG